MSIESQFILSRAEAAGPLGAVAIGSIFSVERREFIRAIRVPFLAVQETS